MGVVVKTVDGENVFERMGVEVREKLFGVMRDVFAILRHLEEMSMFL